MLPEQQDETRNWSAQKLYAAAKGEMSDGNYEKAIKYFETLEARYPYGRYAQQAQLETAYAYFKDNEPVSAISAADRLIKLGEKPTLPRVAEVMGVSRETVERVWPKGVPLDGTGELRVA